MEGPRYCANASLCRNKKNLGAHKASQNLLVFSGNCPESTSFGIACMPGDADFNELQYVFAESFVSK